MKTQYEETGASLQTLRVLVVDDEPLARDLMRQLLDTFPSLEFLGAASSGRDALARIREEQPDLVFLDVEMPGLSGFDVVTAIQADDFLPYVVFVTAYADYALRAFEVNAVDYLLKPVQRERLAEAVARVRERLGQREQREPQDKGALVAAITGASRRDPGGCEDAGDPPAAAGRSVDVLPVREGDTVQLVSFEDIDWVDAAGDYMCVHACGNTHIIRCTMKQLSGRLAHGPFARIHRSTLVNIRKVREITPLSKGECLLHLDDVQLKVSRNYRASIQALLP